MSSGDFSQIVRKTNYGLKLNEEFQEIRDSTLERDIFLNRVILAIVVIFIMVCFSHNKIDLPPGL